MIRRWLVKHFGARERQRQKVKDAVKRLAEREGDVACEKYLVEHYHVESDATDPKLNWWGYAESRQAHEDHKVELTIAERRCSEAHAFVEAQKLKLEKMH